MTRPQSHQQQRIQAVTAAACALCLTLIVLLTLGQSGRGVGRIVGQQLAWLPFRFALRIDGRGINGTYGNDSSLNNLAWASILTTPSSGRFDPFNELLYTVPPNQKTGNAKGQTAQFSVAYPKLYRELTKLTESPALIAPKLLDAPPSSAAGKKVPACAKPKDMNLAHLLDKPTSSFPYARPSYRGGFWSPRHCWPPLARTAILVPYRNRSDNLDLFVPYMQTVLQQQNIAFGIFVIEQANAKLFNRAKLLNIGFKVPQQFANFDCFILHDSDKVPENAANVYSCSSLPRLMISEMRQQSEKTPMYRRGRLYNNFFGGASAVTKQAFERVNGNSNRYYGWGREDDELASRFGVRGMRIQYPGGHVARFVNLRHSNDVIVNTMPWPSWHRVRGTMDKDGLSSLAYTDKGIYLHSLFVLIRADV